MLLRLWPLLIDALDPIAHIPYPAMHPHHCTNCTAHGSLRLSVVHLTIILMS